MEQFQALSPFQPPNLVEAMRPCTEGHEDGRPKYLFGVYTTIPHCVTARIVAVLGFDFVFVDTLHVALSPELLVDIIHTINLASQGKTCAIVRIPTPESDFLTYALDAGAAGIVFPQIETAAEAAAAVKKVRYAYSGGTRSVSPIALINGITNIAPAGHTAETIADRNIAVICQIESVLGVENVEEIAATPGINCLMLGSGDLRASLGLATRPAPEEGDDPKFKAAIAKMVAAAKRNDLSLLAPAFRINPESVDWLKDFKLLVTGVDTLALVKTHQEDLARVKRAVLGEERAVQNGTQNFK